jgi:hypothetical protein
MSTYIHHRLSTVVRVAGQVRAYLSSAIILALVAGWLLSLAPSIHAQVPNQIGLVIVHGDGSATTRCIEFSEPQLTGYDVLARSQLNLSLSADAMGAAICGIDGEGCTVPQEDCFCQMNQNPPLYWSYWQVKEGQWSYSSLGASNTTVQPGSVEGWVWGPGNVNAATPPPAYSLDQICAAATATPTLTFTPLPSPTPPSTATDVPTPIPTVTPLPSPTFTPTYTPWPTVTPTFPAHTATATWTPSATPPAVLNATPTWTPTVTWTPPLMQSQGEQVTAVATATEAAGSATMAEQPQAPERYALLMPIVQAPAPTLVIVAETNAEVALPVATTEPTALPVPTATPAMAAAVVVAQPSPTLTPLDPPVVESTLTPEAAALMITPPAVAALPTLLPAATPPSATVDPQMTRLLGILAAGGILVALPLGLLMVAVVAYWIGRKL